MHPRAPGVFSQYCTLKKKESLVGVHPVSCSQCLDAGNSVEWPSNTDKHGMKVMFTLSI